MLKRLLSIALVFATCLSMSAYVCALEPESYEDSGEWNRYFSPRLFSDEAFVMYRYTNFKEEYTSPPSWGNYQWKVEEVEHDYISRKIEEASVKATSDVVLADFIELSVGKESKLTIESGVTMTVNGNLIIEGTLINKGTIVIGGEQVKQTYEESGSPLCKITNQGAFKNSGAVTITNGSIMNIGTGKIDNKGIIDIRKLKENQVGISNCEIKKGYGMEYGHISNSGTINILCSDRTGIYNEKRTTIDNSGAINKVESAIIKGKISGNQAEKLTS